MKSYKTIISALALSYAQVPYTVYIKNETYLIISDKFFHLHLLLLLNSFPALSLKEQWKKPFSYFVHLMWSRERGGVVLRACNEMKARSYLTTLLTQRKQEAWVSQVNWDWGDRGGASQSQSLLSGGGR